MKICVVKSCGNDINKRPDLCYFNIPKDPYLREDWLEVLGVNSKDNINNLVVCETHFKAKDFRAGKKKELKAHVVPALNLGQCDPFDSDDDFIQYNPVNDPEILELQDEMFSSNTQHTIKQEPQEEQLEQKPSPDLEQETGRRPSRRAALVAAKKIYNTVRSFGISDNNPAERPANLPPSPKPVSTPHPYTRPKPKKTIPVNVDLHMDCCDDMLSPIQAEFLLIAQNQYNMVMKNLRELTACNVKVTQTDINGVPIVVKSAPTVNLKSGNVIINSKSVKIQPLTTVSTMVVPMKLIRSPIVIT